MSHLDNVNICSTFFQALRVLLFGTPYTTFNSDWRKQHINFFSNMSYALSFYKVIFDVFLTFICQLLSWFLFIYFIFFVYLLFIFTYLLGCFHLLTYLFTQFDTRVQIKSKVEKKMFKFQRISHTSSTRQNTGKSIFSCLKYLTKSSSKFSVEARVNKHCRNIDSCIGVNHADSHLSNECWHIRHSINTDKIDYSDG